MQDYSTLEAASSGRKVHVFEVSYFIPHRNHLRGQPQRENVSSYGSIATVRFHDEQVANLVAQKFRAQGILALGPKDKAVTVKTVRLITVRPGKSRWDRMPSERRQEMRRKMYEIYEDRKRMEAGKI